MSVWSALKYRNNAITEREGFIWLFIQIYYMWGVNMLCVKELRSPRDIRFLNRLIAMYHRQGNNPGLSKSRYFVGVVEEDGIEYWVAGAILQSPEAFMVIFRKYNIDTKRSYFMRRVCRFVPRSKCGDILVEFLNKLANMLKNEGKECILTLGLEDHSNALYKLAGYKEIGVTTTGKPVYVKYLQHT